MTDYVVTGACVVAKLAGDTGEGYFYSGALLPAGVPAAEKKRLADLGLVKAVDIETVEIVKGVEVSALVDHTDAPAKPAARK